MRAKLSCLLLVSLFIMSITLSTQADKPPFAADLIIINAKIHTMDQGQPLAEAVAISGNRIIAVGTTKESRKLAGANTRVIDAKGQLVLPGFNDAHVHFMSGGFQLSSVDLRDATSQQEFAERIRAFADKLPPGRWITGGDWDHERCVRFRRDSYRDTLFFLSVSLCCWRRIAATHSRVRALRGDIYHFRSLLRSCRQEGLDQPERRN